MSRDPFPLPSGTDEQREFGFFVSGLVAAWEWELKRREAQSEIFRKKYGLKYCPFHAIYPERNVIPNKINFKFKDKNYKFSKVICGLYKRCESAVSFDSDLISKVEQEVNLKEVKVNTHFNRCPNCGEKKGKAYFTGLGIKISDYSFDFKEHLYLFKRECHSYLAASNGAPDLELKHKPKKPRGKIILSYR